MHRHTRLYRRGAMYYHRAAPPSDVKNTYPKSEETFSLKANNYDEALRLLRIAAIQVDERFAVLRCMLTGAELPERKKQVELSEMHKVKINFCFPSTQLLITEKHII